MGLVQMPNLGSYWSNKHRYKNNVAQKTMSRNRFELLIRCWHFSDTKKAPEGDRIYKIRNIIVKIVNRFQNVMEPVELLAVEETGTFSWKIII